MKISEMKTITTQTVVVNFEKDEYIPFSFSGVHGYAMSYATLTKYETENRTGYRWEAVCHSGGQRMSIRHDDYALRDIDFPPLREAFAQLGWVYPENEHNGKQGWD